MLLVSFVGESCQLFKNNHKQPNYKAQLRMNPPGKAVIMTAN